MIQKYTCQRGAKRWPMKLFYFMLDVTALNAFLLWKPKHPGWEPRQARIHRRLFIRQLAKDLAVPYIARRAMDPRITPTTRNAIKDLGLSGLLHRPSAAALTGQRSKRMKIDKSRKCLTCSKIQKRTNTNTVCSQCYKPICEPHQSVTILCDECANFSSGTSSDSD